MFNALGWVMVMLSWWQRTWHAVPAGKSVDYA